MSFSSRTMKPEDWAKLEHFNADEFKSPEKMGFEFMLWLDRLREEAAVPMTITSSYSDKKYKKKVGGASDSAHIDVPCNAVDIGMRPRPSDPNWNYTRFRIIRAAILSGCQRIGTYANGSLHLDMTHDERPAERMWRVVGNEP